MYCHGESKRVDEDEDKDAVLERLRCDNEPDLLLN